MFRVVMPLVLLTLATQTCFAADDPPPYVPAVGDIVRYERQSVATKGGRDPVEEFPKSQGDEIFTALDGGRAVVSWRKLWPPGVICALPVETPRDVTAITKDGKRYAIRLSSDCGLAVLPAGYYVVNEPARARIVKVITVVSAEQRRKLIDQPRPLTYTIGSVDDGGTLSGIARLFYGDARKWKQIYEANRDTIKNPDVISQGMKIIIPKVDDEKQRQ